MGKDSGNFLEVEAWTSLTDVLTRLLGPVLFQRLVQRESLRPRMLVMADPSQRGSRRTWEIIKGAKNHPERSAA